MIDIEQQAINTFQKNYTYFASSHASLHKKIDILQAAIESNQYAENYSLEYINGYFDLKELSSGELLYGLSSIEHAQETAKNVNLNKDESVIETFYNFPYTQANIEDLDKLTIINSPMTGTAPIVRFMNEHTSSADEMKKIFKFIFFGVGVGKHLTAVSEKIHADSYLIIEDNLELFRLSMFVTDYEVLGKNARLYFSIMDIPGDLKRTYNLFAEDMLIRNGYLKFYLLSDSYASKIKMIQNFAVTKSNLMYPYNYLLRKNVVVSHAIHENYNFLNISKPFENSEFFDKPILYLAAGPSLSAHTQWVRENQDCFIVVAVFMIVAKLEAAGIRPDIVIHVDEADEPVEATLKKMKDKDYLKESLFILSASVALSLLEPISKKENIFLIEDRTRYKKDHGFIEFFSVGEVGYALSLIFSAQKIYLLGLDLALDQKTGKTHTEGHATTKKVDINKTDVGPEEQASLRETLIPVRGNKQDTVFTTPLYDTSIYQVNYFTSLHKQKSQNIYNLSNGAYFNESISTDINDIKLQSLDKQNLKSVLLSTLKNKSTDYLSDVEKNNIIVRKNEVKKKAKLIERFAKQNIKNIEDFRSKLIGLIESLIKPVSQELNEVSEILLNYFQTVGNYVGNFLNTENMNHSNEFAKELKYILSRQLYKILHDIGNFEFNYINGEKYFDVKEYKELKIKILNLKLKASPLNQVDELYFFEKLPYLSIDTKKSNCKNCVSFLVSNANIENKDFMNYIKDLYIKYPEVIFKAFYFNVEQKQEAIETVFDDSFDKLQFIEVINIEDVLDVAIFLYPFVQGFNTKVHRAFKESNVDFFTIAYKKSVIGKLRDMDLQKDDLQMLEPERFNHSIDELKESNYNATFLNIIKALKYSKDTDTVVVKDRELYEIYHYDRFDYALRYENFRRYYFSLRKKA